MLGLDWTLVVRWLPYLLEGTLRTIGFTGVGMSAGLLIGSAVGLARLSGNRWLRTVAGAYIDFFRGTPLLVQLMLIHFALLPSIFGKAQSPVISGALGLALNAAGYIAEIVRAGIQSIDRGQSEAARSLGMTANQAMRYVIMPQAYRRIVPPLGNEFIAMLKDSSLLFVLTVEELSTRGRLMVGRTFRPWEGWIPVALLYLALTLTFSQLLSRYERKLNPVDHRS